MYLSQFLSFLTLHCSVAVILYQISLVTNNHDSCAVIRSFLKHVYTCKKLVTINLLCGLAYLDFLVTRFPMNLTMKSEVNEIHIRRGFTFFFPYSSQMSSIFLHRLTL